MIHKSLFAALNVSTAIVMCAAATPAQAQAAGFNLPAQELGKSLRAVATKTGTNIVFDPAIAAGKRAPRLKGKYSAQSALTHLLHNSGLTVSDTSSGTFIVRANSGNVGGPDEGAQQIADGSQNPPSSSGNNDTVATDEQITVTGSRLKRAVNGFPLNSYSREEIEASGQPNLSGYLSTLNEVSIVTPSAGVFSYNNNATVQLRGLPVGTTLTLLNGRRLQSFGSSSGALVFDLNSIPFEAIERVDVVPVGSSAIYGGDALAGVVNIILKRSFEGLAVGANYGFGAGTQDGTLSFAAGHRFDRGSVLLVGSVGKTTPLTTAERGFFRDADYRRFGGVDTRVNTCLPGTVSSLSGDELPGLGATLAGIPDRDSETRPSISDFAATAGSPNLCGEYGTGPGSSLVNESKRYALHLGGDYEVADWLTMFGEATYNRERIGISFYPITLRNVVVPASNAFNPFGVDVSVTTQLGTENGFPGRTRTTNFKRFLVGGRGKLATDWDYEVTAMTARDDSESRELGELLDGTALTAALASSDPATALNLFTTGRAASYQVLHGIWGSRPARKGAGRRDQVNAFVRGEFGGLPAGRIEVVAGGEASRDTWKTSGTGFQYDTRRTSAAAFAEANVPLLSTRGGGELVSLSLAGRWDSFSDFGNAATYQAGLEIKPAKNLHVRLATSTSFKPPSLLQLNPSPATYTTEIWGLRDPKRGNEPIVGGEVVLGPNASLAAEKGKAATLGVAWEPVQVPNLRLGATLWRVEINNLVTLLLPQTALDYEDLFSSLVTRGPSVDGVPGQVTRVDVVYVNFGSIRANGLDLEASYTQPTPIGSLNLSASATRTTKYDAVLAPGAPTENRLSLRTADFWAPKWKARASVQLDSGEWQLGVTGRYIGSYADSNTSNWKLGDRLAYDVSAGFNISSRAQLIATIVNVGNQLPEFSPASYGYYDVTQGDWRGRYANLRLSTRW